jgi:hypothetical protein
VVNISFGGHLFQQQILTNDLFFRGNQSTWELRLTRFLTQSFINIHHHCSKMRQRKKKNRHIQTSVKSISQIIQTYPEH